jgi:cytosine/adenosine deaminase-related metal-dependent hydrolase
VARGTGLACCPLSNFYFSGGAFPLRRAQVLLPIGAGLS